MNGKSAMVVLGAFVIGAIFLGLLLVNKGDGPVTGMILADQALEDTQSYRDAAQSHGDGIYLVVSNAYNQFQEDYQSEIPEGRDLYATIHFVECPKGSEYSGRWVRDGVTIREDLGALPTGPEGVLSYRLDGSGVIKGSYAFELYDEDGKRFEKTFSVE